MIQLNGLRRCGSAVVVITILTLLLTTPSSQARPKFSEPQALERGAGVNLASIVSQGDGRSVAVWRTLNSGPAEVRASWIDERGLPSSPLTVAASFSYSGKPSVAAAGDGVVGVLWKSYEGPPSTGTRSHLDLARVESSGEVTRPDVLDEDAAGVAESRLATNSTGAGVAMWARFDWTAPVGTPFELRWVRLDSSGETVGATSSAVVPFNSRPRTSPSFEVVIDDRGWISVVFSSYSEIRLLRIDPDDDLQPPSLLARTATGSVHFELGIDGVGRATVTWREQAARERGRDRIWARRVGEDGTVGRLREIATSKRRLGAPSLVLDSEGRVLLAWARSRELRRKSGPGLASGRIILARLRANARPAYVRPVTPKRFKAASPDLGVDGRDRIYAAFQRRGPRRDPCEASVSRWRVAALRVATRTGEVRWRRHLGRAAFLGRGPFPLAGSGQRVLFAWDRPGENCRETVVSRPLG